MAKILIFYKDLKNCKKMHNKQEYNSNYSKSSQISVLEIPKTIFFFLILEV